MREGTAPLQPWFGIFCAGNEKPGVAMETAIPCSLCHSLWEVPACRGWGRCAGDSPAALSAGMQKRQLWGWWRGRVGVQGRMGRGMGSLGCRAPDLRGKGSHGAQTASLEPSWAWSPTLERQQFVEPCRVGSGKSLGPTVTETRA